MSLENTPPLPGLAGLSEDLLITIFRNLGMRSRQATLPLVCRRWRELAHAPPLLRHVALSIRCTSTSSSSSSSSRAAAAAPEAATARMSSLFQWLRCRAAGSVRYIHLQLETQPSMHLLEAADLAADLAAALAACAAAAPLAELHLRLRGLPGPASLAGCCTGSLRRLEVVVQGSPLYATYPATLQACSALEELLLAGQPLWLGGPAGASSAAPPAFHLPATLTQLSLAGGCSESGLPQELASLPRLRRLGLSHMDCDPEGYTPLSGLASLECLSVSGCPSFPIALLASLPSLSALQLHDSPLLSGAGEAAACAQLQGALPALGPRLTHLVLRCGQLCSCAPPALTALTRLGFLAWDGPPPSRPGLPGGEWLAGLQRALLPADMAAASLAREGAPPHAQLELLLLHPLWPGGLPAYRSLLAWAPHQPVLRRLCLGLSDGGPGLSDAPARCSLPFPPLPKVQLAATLLEDALEAQRAQPLLKIEAGCPSDAFAELAEV